MSRLSNGVNSINTVAPNSTMDKSKDWQLELLMEKLRSKTSQLKSLTEISKAVRMTMLDKRYALDSVEKAHHQKCLDTLQHSIKVTSLQSMIERLESLTRQLGLKFVVGHLGVELFISSDMFYLEIILDQSGAVLDVKVHHEGKKEQQSCAELVSCLSRGDFVDFTAQLEGFASIYQLNAEKKVKSKAFTALQSLESDLSTLAQLQTFMKEPFNLLYKSPVGILERRRGGHPMKLTYFVSPYDLIDAEKADLEPLTVESITNKNLGYSVTVCMEGSAAHKLQTTTLITVNRNVNGKNTPSFATLSSQNSTAIPACFVLKLNKPMPMCVALARQIKQLTEMDCADLSSPQPLLSLITSHASEGKLEGGSNKGLFVTLPDQQHCYFLTENKNMEGILVHSIPFSHPCHVSQILVILRQQALFNTIITSCIRPNSKQDIENMILFEISALSWTHISISFEEDESIATAELDLTDISNLSCRIHSPGTPPPQNAPDTASELATKVLNISFSIPITMRSVLHLWDKRVARKNLYNGHENFSLPLGPGDPGGHKGGSGGSMTEFGGLDSKIKQEPSGSAGMGHGINLNMNHSHQGMFLNESILANNNFSNFSSSENILSNMELTNILAGTGQSEKVSKKLHKRKTSDDAWKGAKRRVGDESDLMETSSCDSTSRSTPLSQDTVSEIPTPNSVLGFHSDLELSTLDPTELLSGSDKPVSDFDNMDELGDVEEMLTSSGVKKQKSPSPSSHLLVDLGESKNLVPPSVSITPIPTCSSQGFTQQVSSASKPGIEIIPITTASPTLLPNSITITPICSNQAKSLDERNRDKKSTKSRCSSDEKSRLDKKRKRKRDESPMGPPEKLPLKQDPLSKPVSVSIKPAESPPLSNVTPTSPGMLRKFSTSPNRNMSSLSGKLSPSLLKPGLKTTTSSHNSPKHSPAHIPSSPKHTIPGLSSPKSHGTSPKHPSTSGSGKPSMSTLKSAANSPSSKSGGGESKTKSIGKDASREKDKRSAFGVSNSSKAKSAVKLKQLDLNTASDSVVITQDLPSPVGGTIDLLKSNSNQARKCKSSLSAVIEKLKSSQHDTATDLTGKSITGNGSNNGSGSKDRQLTGKLSEGANKGGVSKMGENKNSEYMVKPSSDGMKITINKTRTKDSGKSAKAGSSGTGSPKTHTGLKPGVNSGPASKKPQQQSAQKPSSSSNLTSSPSFGTFKSTSGSSNSSSSSSSSTKPVSSNVKSIAGGISKSVMKQGSPKSATDLSRSKERSKITKSQSEKSIFSSREGRKSSPIQQNECDFKMTLSKIESNYPSPLIMEGLMKLDKNYQIPKLSARASGDDKKMLPNKNEVNNINRENKLFDMMSKTDIGSLKFPLAIPMGVESKIRNNVNNIVPNVTVSNSPLPLTSSSSPKLNTEVATDKKDVSQGKDEGGGYKVNYPIATLKNFSSLTSSNEPLSLSTKSVDLTSKFIAPAPKDDKKDTKGKDTTGDLLLDFSSTSKINSQPPYPPSPSVSVHIVKSPAPSPLINPSPHSASPCITDDELMDEALVGLGK